MFKIASLGATIVVCGTPESFRALEAIQRFQIPIPARLKVALNNKRQVDKPHPANPNLYRECDSARPDLE
jgi:hypothetical protein